MPSTQVPDGVTDGIPRYFLTDGMRHTLRGKCIYFLRMTPKVSDALCAPHLCTSV